MKERKKIFLVSRNQKNVDIAIAIHICCFFFKKTSNEKCNKHKDKNKRGHALMIKGLVHQGNITNINIYVANSRTPKYMKQILIDWREK